MAQKNELTKEQKEYQDLLDKVKLLPQPSVYRNSTPVASISDAHLALWDVLTAAVLMNLNVLLLGERGEGKTQLQNEVKNLYFGGKATYIRMRDNMRTRDLFEVYNLEKLTSAKGNVLEAKEKTGAIKNLLTIIDEINRAHEKVQNQVFDIYDGYIIFEGAGGTEKISLGRKVEANLYYHTAVASANIGNAKYAGTSQIDSALLDRSHLILNVDNFTPSTLDNALILAELTTPKVIESEQQDLGEEIITIYRKTKDIKLSLDALIALLYLKKGLDYCSKDAGNSKTPILHALPVMCEGCNELGKGCGYTYPVSIRSEKAIALLAKGLKVVADAKSENVQSMRVHYQDILNAFMLVAPYSGMLDENWVQQEFNGNQYRAIRAVASTIALEIKNLAPDLKNSYLKAIQGSLSSVHKTKFVDRWSWYGDFLDEFNSVAKNLGDLSRIPTTERGDATKEYPLLRWLE